MNDEDTIVVPKRTWEALEKLAKKRGHTIGETIRHCTNTEVYMDEQLEKKSMILCQDIEGQVWKVVFTHMKA